MARIKLSGSDKKYGEIRISIIKMKIVILNPKISFHGKKRMKKDFINITICPKRVIIPSLMKK